MTLLLGVGGPNEDHVLARRSAMGQVVAKGLRGSPSLSGLWRAGTEPSGGIALTAETTTSGVNFIIRVEGGRGAGARHEEESRR